MTVKQTTKKSADDRAEGLRILSNLLGIEITRVAKGCRVGEMIYRLETELGPLVVENTETLMSRTRMARLLFERFNHVMPLPRSKDDWRRVLVAYTLAMEELGDQEFV